MFKTIITTYMLLSSFLWSYAQPVPAEDENIPYLMTFGPEAKTSWGDDDFTQTFFFMIPKEITAPVFIRVYDPNISGEIDEINDVWNTEMEYTIYGGAGTYTNEDAQNPQPVGNYRSGNQLASKVFAKDIAYEGKWYTFGPFNPTEGEFVEKFDAHIFKIIVQGIAGDDGNLYRFYLSSQNNSNQKIEGGNAFSYEYSFRMHDDPNQVSHIYPYIDDKTTSIKQSNFDWDNDGFIRIVSVARKGKIVKASGDNNWARSEFKILEEEKNFSLDFQFIKKKTPPVINNNVVVYIRNQYGKLLPFYTIPIGGVPKYKYKIGVKRF